MMRATSPVVLTRFDIIHPEFECNQRDLTEWLAAAHSLTQQACSEDTQAGIQRRVRRYACSSDRVGHRGHSLTDYNHQNWSDMEVARLLDSPQGVGISKRTQKYIQITQDVFKRFYDADAPTYLIHVTCTGYASPSSAQRLVSERGWGSKTSVLHAYHMGCYAAIPAIRIARGLSNNSERVDIVHTEVCSLHLDVSDHTPEQLVVQSLFADGFVKYSLDTGLSEDPGLEVVAIADEILPDSESDMTWTPSEAGMRMTLSREVPEKVMKGLSSFLLRLFKTAGLDYENARRSAVFAIHPGGPKIIDAAQVLLQLDDTQVAASRRILFEHGNMSSATLPHIWNEILQDQAILDGTWVVSLAFGPGLTIYGCLLKKRGPTSRNGSDHEDVFMAS